MPPKLRRGPSRRQQLGMMGARFGGRIGGLLGRHGPGPGLEGPRARFENESATAAAKLAAKDTAAQKNAYRSLLHEHKNRDAHQEFVREFNNNLSRMPKGFRNSLDEATRRHVKFTLLQLGYKKGEVKKFFDGLEKIMLDHGVPPNPRQFFTDHVDMIRKNVEQSN